MTPELIDALARIVGARWVRSRRAELATFTMDGLPTRESYPGLVVLPADGAQVREVVRLLYLVGVPFVARGAGTGLSGGAVADPDTVIIALTRMNRILAVDPVRRRAAVQPGVINARLTDAAAPHGLHYVPDPSSQTACTVGGNVAENAGGPHCLKYGVTTNHVVELEVVLPDGEVVRLGSPHGEPWG
ncbi:MAG TPA: FAD-binding protein, partial [Gemmatimonadales bacterium]